MRHRNGTPLLARRMCHVCAVRMLTGRGASNLLPARCAMSVQSVCSQDTVMTRTGLTASSSSARIGSTDSLSSGQTRHTHAPPCQIHHACTVRTRAGRGIYLPPPLRLNHAIPYSPCVCSYRAERAKSKILQGEHTHTYTARGVFIPRNPPCKPRTYSEGVTPQGAHTHLRERRPARRGVWVGLAVAISIVSVAQQLRRMVPPSL